jgi:hypothetical protein
MTWQSTRRVSRHLTLHGVAPVMTWQEESAELARLQRAEVERDAKDQRVEVPDDARTSPSLALASLCSLSLVP